MSNFNAAEAARLIRKGRRAEESGKALSGCFASLVTNALTTMFHGWLFMLVVGNLHHKWWPAMPPIGYLWAVMTVGLLSGVFSKKDES